MVAEKLPITCKCCSQTFRFSPDHQGKKTACPGCGIELTLTADQPDITGKWIAFYAIGFVVIVVAGLLISLQYIFSEDHPIDTTSQVVAEDHSAVADEPEANDHVKTTADDESTEDDGEAKRKGRDWLTMTEEQQFDLCLSVLEEGQDDHMHKLSLWMFLSGQIVENDQKVMDMDMDDILILGHALWGIQPLIELGFQNSTQTQMFIVPKRTFVPIFWESEEVIVAHLLDQEGQAVRSNLITDFEPPFTGTSFIWVDPGLYCLDVTCNDSWKIALYRDLGQAKRQNRAFHE